MGTIIKTRHKKSVGAVLFALCFFTFGPVISYPFVHDDFIFIAHNPFINDLSSIPDIFLHRASLDNVALANPYYRPILEIVYRLQYHFFHLNPSGYHLTNIFLHFCNSLLIFSLLNHLTQKPNLAAVATFLFAVHPVQTEAVTCVSGISNLLSAFFCLTSLLLYIKAFPNNKDTPNWIFLTGALFFYIAAMFSKEQTIVLPLALILYDRCYAPRHNPARGGYILGKGLFFLAALQYLVWRKMVLGTAVVPFSVINRELLLRVLAVPRTLLTYLQLVLFPNGLHYYRNIDLFDPAWTPIILSILLIVGLIWILRGLPRESVRLILFGLGWLLIFLLPVINIIPIIIEYSFAAVFEHFLYLPIAGILLAGLTIAESLMEKIIVPSGRPIKSIFAGIFIVLCVLLSVRQNTYWRGEVPLFERTVKYENNFGRGHVLLGRAHMKAGAYSKAVPAFQKALNTFEHYREVIPSPLAKDLYAKLILDVQQDLAICNKHLTAETRTK